VYKEIFLLLGSNLGDRLQTISRAKRSIEALAGKIIKQSSPYQTEAWGNTDQDSFLNQVLEINSKHTPQVLLSLLLRVEAELGRERKEKWGPRTIDIDILFFGNTIMATPDLIIPHPAIADRRFTLIPLAEIAPDFVHPTLKKNCRQLLDECKDMLEVKLFSTNS
jgi:2-amino-4-hydroxy-6-hydroxymethyldihydropteridine diphosphokinase